jgi:hypothetical protein
MKIAGWLSVVVIAGIISFSTPVHAATNLPFGQVTTGTIGSAAQINHYTFSASKGDAISFTIAASGISPVIQVFVSGSATPFETGNLYACNGTVLTMNTDGSVVLPSSPGGVYDVWVSDCATTNTGSYSLYAQRLNDPSGASSLPLAKVTTGSIGSEAQSNTYTFTAAAGDYVNLVTLASGISPQIFIYNPDGTQLATNNLYACNGSNMEWDQIKFPSAGTYTLLFDDCGHTNKGSYSVYFQRTNKPAGSVSDLLWGQVQTGSIPAIPVSEVYTFQGTANDGLDFTIDANGFSPELVLYNPDGSQFGENNIYACNGSNMQWNGITLPKTGRYYLFVKDCSNLNKGTYTLSSQCAGTCLLPTPVITSVKPTNILAGSGGFTLTVNGANFVNVNANSVVQWDGADLSTTFVNTSQLTALVPASDDATAGNGSITVFTPSPGGGTSGSVAFPVDNPKPALTTLSPNSATAGGAGFTVTVNGSNFVAGSVVSWNGAALTSKFVSSTQLTATVPASDVATAGTPTVAVTNSSPGGGSASLQFTIDNPAPVLSGISPTSVTAGGSSATTLTVNGSGFVNSSSVKWNGAGLSATYVSATKLTATVPTSDTACGSADSITVVNATPGGGTSASQTLTVNNPLPKVSSISPTSAAAGSGQFTLTVNGSNFVSCSAIQWNGTVLTTKFVSAAQLTATIPASDLASSGTADVTVFSPKPGGGSSSPTQAFTIGPFPVPVVTSIQPTSATAGAAVFTLTINGSKFVQSSTVDWNGIALNTTYVSSTQLTAAVPASDIVTAGYDTVTVVNPSPGGGPSNPGQTFTVNNPIPKSTSMSPTVTPASGPKFTLTVNGSNFVSKSVVQWNTSNLVTSYVSGSQLTATVPASDIASEGSAAVTIVNPSPGGGTTSPALTFTIENPLAATPVINPTAGSYGYGIMVSISEPSSTPGATIYYTVNGTTPTSGSTKYSSPFLVDGSATVQAIADAPNYTQGQVASSIFIIGGSPTVLALPAVNITSSGGTLRAIVTGHSLSGQMSFVYGTSKVALTNTTPMQALAASTSGVVFQAALTGLNANTTYYYQAVVTTPGGASSGAVLSFITP